MNICFSGKTINSKQPELNFLRLYLLDYCVNFIYSFFIPENWELSLKHVERFMLVDDFCCYVPVFVSVSG